MDYHIEIVRRKRNTAGAKAPNDVTKIWNDMGMKAFHMPMFPENKSILFQKVWLMTVAFYYWLKLLFKVHQKDRVFYQHPMYGHRLSAKMIPVIKRCKKCRFIVLIHDLESLRNGIEGIIEDNVKRNEVADNQLLREFDYIICHNKYMKKYLCEQGFDEKKIICLEIFDYLCENNKRRFCKNEKASVAIAGNLAMGKSGYLYKFFKEVDSLEMHLYGINYEDTFHSKNVNYHGSFSPEELPGKLEGDFGIVWDGDMLETCEGNTGNYLRFNNPHKTSLYLAANMPVIVWSQAAIAEFVIENEVGIVVDDLNEVRRRIDEVTQEEYKNLSLKASIIGEKIREGYYLIEAVKQVI